ncbi:hypothetical protein CCAN12_800092 [Capnocytophaga canimorsus]|uniref:Uncharacterized protein n=1 Tax=Capnocytophaga canimorsus TaxID=28188 RepID=A0A0B7HPF1_9FLAO|nr:hypothetical protein CCAN12_800092 [Capnocytophaga canimorsus]
MPGRALKVLLIRDKGTFFNLFSFILNWVGSMLFFPKKMKGALWGGGYGSIFLCKQRKAQQ